MNDSQSPPDAGSSPKGGKADAARRTAFRLRDAELVATTRRDMFGDGPLLDALAGHALPREKGHGLAANADTAASQTGTEPLPADPGAAADEPPQAEAPVPPDAAVPAGQAVDPETKPAQSLDAIIDSFPADPASQVEEELPPELQVDGAGLAASGFALTGRDSEADGFASDQDSPTGPERFQVSAIFAGLASSPPPEEDEVSQEHPEGASVPGNDPAGEHSQRAAAPRQLAAAAPGLGVPLFDQPPADAPEPAGWQPAAPAAEHAPLSDTDEPPETSPGPHREPGSIGPAPYPEPAGWPPYLEPPGYQAADPDAPLLEPPSLVGRSGPAGDASSSPLPAPPAWPPFPEQPGSDAGLSDREPAGLPPYIELPAHPEGDGEHSASSVPPAFAEPEPPGAAPTFGEAPPIDAPPFAAPRGMPAFPDRPAAAAPPERWEMPRFPDFEASTPALDAAARVDATSKIAAEANATAQALDHLQRLLDKTASPAAPQPTYAPAQPRHPYNAPFHFPQDEPIQFAREMAPMLPLPLSPPPSERSGSKNVYLLGFLTGLLLSVMAGAALYFLINTG